MRRTTVRQPTEHGMEVVLANLEVGTDEALSVRGGFTARGLDQKRGTGVMDLRALDSSDSLASESTAGSPH